MKNASMPISDKAIGTTPTVTRATSAPAAERPWWKEGYLWLVISGPVGVMLACAITAFYILQGPDAVVPEDHYRESLEIKRQLEAAQAEMQPALVGRNHSATGGKKDDAGR